MEPISRARSLPELAERAAHSRWLSLDLSMALRELKLKAKAELALQLLLDGGRRLTVGEFFLLHDFHRFLEASGTLEEVISAFARWLEKHEAKALAQPLEGWIELLHASSIPGLADWSAGMLGPVSHKLSLETLGRLAKQNRLDVGEERQLAAALRGLEARASSARSAPAPELAATGDERLDALRRALAALRAGLNQSWPRRLLEGRLRVSAEGDDLLADLRIQGDARDSALYRSWQRDQLYASRSDVDELQDQRGQAGDRGAGARRALGPPLPEGTLRLAAVSSWRLGLSLHCWCGREECLHRAVFLDLLLEGTEKLSLAASQVLRLLLVPAWQRALDELSAPVVRDRADQPGILSFVIGKHTVDARFHVEGKKGPSKRGEPVRDGMARLIPRLRGLDRKIAETWALAGRDFRYASDATPFFGDALLLLEGHPAVRMEDGGACVPARIVRAEVRVAETETGVALSVVAAGRPLEPQQLARGFRSSSGRVMPRFGEDEVQLVLVPDEVARLLATLNAHGKSFPREALPGLVSILPRLEAVAQVELPDDLKGEEHPGASKPVIRIEPSGAGLLISLRSEPLASGPLFVPGQGGPLSASFDGTRRRFARRDFERELHEASSVAAELSLDPAHAGEPFTWPIEAGDRSVELLRRVHHLAEAGQPVEWIAPKAKFTKPAALNKLNLRIERKRDWFGLDGHVDIDERRVGLAQLLEAARARRRWVQLGPGDFAELSDEILARLTPLAHLTGPKETLPTLTLGALPLIEAITPEIEGLDAAEGWRQLTERLAQAREKSFPLPADLRVELRDYQAEGFRWLSRLADWGAGACLADDMGLGKTVQALALLLSRGALGPALVVAPSSVLHSWRVEANRFAPALRLHLFNELEDGQRALDHLGPGDVVVVSWSLLARNASVFAARKFATVILDEVQAIKNAGTQRAKAAHGLSAEFVVALTGTPVENHLGELWSLFRAVLPSLFGSEEWFRIRFASGEPEATQALAQLIQPFILRRKKSEVARELPARTEVDVLVPLSPEERTLYDDVRLAAARDIDSLTGESQRFDVLAALTRLRLTACHPKLQDPQWRGPASKLARLLELLRDLSAGGHRALVFSQFTKHLALVSEALRAEGIPFSYLDGATPLAERQRRVEQFQAGQGGDLFLISLKAGGTGLTLTAADYVIHLDPWWNPAVEDQASDRAHRIGQTKPVTVYRLIAEATIEQQILKLHREKRELVDALLAGTDRAAKLSAEELAALIRGS